MEGVVNEGADVVEDHADTGRPAGSDEEELLSESGESIEREEVTFPFCSWGSRHYHRAFLKSVIPIKAQRHPRYH